ncbi:SDR family NAD(P)-dependent oxidoreductase [Nereida sp. MMG025]|uniref:SDR family NAD(P)-dependent oxidoreductase n=1 Tax=Nereida sp. MMG025 TaxID=2909981 RepID=UPI001F3D71E6|nr:SDR family oxidoreductase [Nereida sp. MMG025]MCF6445261.1 SDR family oxidoreductase [Nereida sp. MMG025]
MHLTGKHALVTGGGTGIGLAIAKRLQADGATVTITGRRLHVLQDVGQGMNALTMDVTDEAATRSAIARAADHFGPIDICVANAGIAEGRAFAKADMEHWRKIMATNLDGAFTTIQASMETMPANWGRVIAVSSIAGVRGLKGAIAYTASKHGLIGLIRGLSEEYMRPAQPSGITFNAICPGYVDTDIVTRNSRAIAGASGMTEDDAQQTMVRANRHKRLIDADEVADVAAMLCGPNSGSINGQALQIAGGQV